MASPIRTARVPLRYRHRQYILTVVPMLVSRDGAAEPGMVTIKSLSYSCELSLATTVATSPLLLISPSFASEKPSLMSSRLSDRGAFMQATVPVQRFDYH